MLKEMNTYTNKKLKKERGETNYVKQHTERANL